jgi:hypothetical protein
MPSTTTPLPLPDTQRDPSGRLNFASKAVLHADGVDFSSGASFKIKMDEFELLEELGKGNYGTVQKVWHKPTKVTMALKVRLVWGLSFWFGGGWGVLEEGGLRALRWCRATRGENVSWMLRRGTRETPEIWANRTGSVQCLPAWLA